MVFGRELSCGLMFLVCGEGLLCGLMLMVFGEGGFSV